MCHNGCVQIQIWNSPLQTFRDERLEVNISDDTEPSPKQERRTGGQNREKAGRLHQKQRALTQTPTYRWYKRGKELNKLLCFRSNPTVVFLYVL